MHHSRVDTNVFHIRNLSIADPAAGADISFGVPVNMRIQILSFRMQLVTDATVINRHIAATASDGSINFSRFSHTTLQTATQTRIYHATVGNTNVESAVDGLNISIPLPNDLYLNPTDSFITLIDNLQAGDQISGASIRVKVWVVED